MARDRSVLGAPLGTDGPWLAAILGALDELHVLLDERLPPAQRGPVRVAEPAPESVPPGAIPLSEPAVDDPPETDDEPVPAAEPLPDPPPRSGRGASVDAWRAWADRAGVALLDPSASRDDIIFACVAAGVLEGK